MFITPLMLDGLPIADNSEELSMSSRKLGYHDPELNLKGRNGRCEPRCVISGLERSRIDVGCDERGFIDTSLNKTNVRHGWMSFTHVGES